MAGSGAGLANDTGEYNCFLNAIIQVQDSPETPKHPLPMYVKAPYNAA